MTKHGQRTTGYLVIQTWSTNLPDAASNSELDPQVLCFSVGVFRLSLSANCGKESMTATCNNVYKEVEQDVLYWVTVLLHTTLSPSSSLMFAWLTIYSLSSVA